MQLPSEFCRLPGTSSMNWQERSGNNQHLTASFAIGGNTRSSLLPYGYIILARNGNARCCLYFAAPSPDSRAGWQMPARMAESTRLWLYCATICEGVLQLLWRRQTWLT